MRMTVFSHGSNVNFQTSTREMFFPDLEELIQQKMQDSSSFVVGMLKPDKEQIAVFGQLQAVSLQTDVHTFELVEDEAIVYDQNTFLISQEAVFTIDDERAGQVEYRVLYFTYEVDGAETVLFFMDESAVTHPLACVVQFYEQVKDVGRDVDFSLVGCTANQWKPNK
jgi:hypothetical protein